ncbi:MAG: DUF2786 domain-containing protein [Lachnospiraceae bacterium]|nr:DUF2786 domain-containing protein [Lachnospiraceae bacterium]
MAIDYKAKIKKLLALADSPNENEAKAALMKARALMAEHKLREADCMDTRNMTVERRLTGLTCTKRNGGWMAPLVLFRILYAPKPYHSPSK